MKGFNATAMPILKGHQANAVMKEAIVLDMGDLRREAARLLSEARARSRQVEEEAKQEANRISTAAYELAFAEGKVRGNEEGAAEGAEEGRARAFQEWTEKLESLEEAWIRAARSWESQRERIDREARQAVLEFAVLLAGKVVHRVIEVDHEVVVDQVKAALDHVLQPLDVAIRINGDDRPVLDRAMPELVRQIGGLEHVQLVDDPSVDRAGCIVQYGEGRIDATVAAQLRRLVETVVPDRAQSEEPA